MAAFRLKDTMLVNLKAEKLVIERIIQKPNSDFLRNNVLIEERDYCEKKEEEGAKLEFLDAWINEWKLRREQEDAGKLESAAPLV